ncbi:MAG TPA: OmpH family outer membrane protein [Clostridiales bacterium]|nr:OmpH family outer membrane protein [Clostridiales bacterium]HQP69393.1 OmpH family outer membrane protein [Clostridiales bacterium]
MKKIVTVMVLIASMVVFAEMKFGFINSDKVLAEYNEAKKAKELLSKWNKEKEAEAVKMESEIKALEEEIKNMSVMVSEEKRNEKMAEGQKKLQDYYQFKDKVWGQTGDFYKKNNELMQPVIDKINEVIKQVSEKEKYDLVCDANTGTLLYAKPEYEMTDKIIKELNK